MKGLLVFCMLATVAVAQDIMDMNSTVSAARLQELVNIQDNYDESLAAQARRSHFFCLNRTTNRETGEVTITDFEQNRENVWTLFLQMPVISFLDPQRKQALMDTILNILGGGMTTDDICLGTYETYELSYFRESILIRVYGRNSPINGDDMSTTFNTNVDQAFNNGGNEYVISYPGQGDVIAFNISSSDYYRDLLQPSVVTNEGVDLSSLAVFIGSYGGNYTFATDTNDTVSMNIGSQPRRNFASNTNPINYGLEPGDIVFAVFGSILLLLVTLLMFFGYCIHPFFLA